MDWEGTVGHIHTCMHISLHVFHMPVKLHTTASRYTAAITCMRYCWTCTTPGGSCHVDGILNRLSCVDNVLMHVRL